MKLFKKVSVMALSAIMLFSAMACDSQEGASIGNDNAAVNNAAQAVRGDISSNTGMEGGVDAASVDTEFKTYDNKSYNEYLVGENATIENQWEGYGIGDPFVMRYNGMYYLYCSTLDSELGVRAYKSADLVNWTPITGTGLRYGYVSQDPVTKAAYAPEVYYWNGTFYMYTSPGGNGHYILTSNSPEGPFVKATNNFGLSIDGSVLIDDDESMWFTYANNGGIRMAKMDSMLSVDVSSTPLLNNTSIGGWTEGSYILKRDGIYYLTYTGNHVASDGYRIAYATTDKITNSSGKVNRNAWTRAENNPLVLETESELKGIGHSSTVLGPDMDSYYLAYHMLNSSGGPNRSLGIDRLLFNGKQMTVSTNLTGSIVPTLPNFYASGADEDKFDTADGYVLSKTATADDFTAEFNLTGAAVSEYVVGYKDTNNYVSVKIDLSEKTIVLSKTSNGVATQVATGTLVNDFDANSLHTVRISNRDGKVDVVFDNMTKIDNAELDIPAGKIGYKGISSDATIGYTAYSNVAMGMSDQKEAKQAEGEIGASTYLYEDRYENTTKLGNGSGVSVLEEGSFAGVKSMTLANKGDCAAYLVNFKQTGRYGLELTYPTSLGGKKIGVRLGDGTIWRCTLPVVDTTEEYVKAIVGELNASAGIDTIRLENVNDDTSISYISFGFVKVANVTPSYEQSLSDYVTTGVDYKTIWKLKDDGHYAKAGTRQLVYFGDNTITDFTMEVEVKLEGKTGTSTAGIVFHAQNYAASSHDSYASIQGYYLAINNNQVVLERLNYADDSTQIGTYVQGNPFATSDTFIPLKIQVRGNTFTVWSGETKLIEASDAYAFTAGKLGLYTNGAAVVFKNLKVSA